MRWHLRLALALLAMFSAWSAAAADLDYGLQPVKVAADTYVFQGANEDFSFDNGGNIVNTGFIVTEVGVVVIDSGPSRLYGEQMRAAITKVTDLPVIRVFITHMHPDHFLGNQAYDDVPILALAGTIDGIRSQANAFTDNMYRLAGSWMRGTEAVRPDEAIDEGELSFGSRRLQVIAGGGHTPDDLMLLDHATGVLFAGDLVFHDRAPTTPHAELDIWLRSLRRIQALPVEVLVPGHGPVTRDLHPVMQTRGYLDWLEQTLNTAARSGVDMAELLYTPLPGEFDALSVMPAEFHRSVSHLYPQRERRELPRVSN